MKEMTPERWGLVMQWFERIVTADTESRTALFEEAENIDPSLRQELEALHNADAVADEFLERPAAEMLAQHIPTMPSRIGPYQLQQIIGRGGMGIVYKAERVDGAYQQTVALKLVRHGFESEEVHTRFYRERQILARLEHPNIARLLDGGTTEDGCPWLAMEYIEGESLHEFCARRQLHIEDRLRLFQDVCSAVQYSHQNFILHRDLKPSNVLVTKEGVPKLLDFGIARLLAPDPLAPEMKLTTMQHPQTPEYASPEQINKQPLNVTSDVYSLGVVLYELLTGVRPTTTFSPTNPTIPEKPSTVVRTNSCATTPPETARASLSRILRGDLDTIVLKALRNEPQHRYASVEQFSDDIQRYLDRLPVLARKGNLTYRTTKFFQRHRASLAAAMLVFLSLCLGLILTTWQARVAQAAQHHAEAERSNAEQQRARAEAERRRAEEALARVEAERRNAESQQRLAEQASAKARQQQQRAEREQKRAEAALASAQHERSRAETESARAGRRFEEVRNLANAMLFDVHDEIDVLTGATKARAMLVKLAHEYLDRLVNEAGEDLSLQQELARSYVKLGDIQGNSRAGELGNKPAALESYRQAFSLQQKVVRASNKNLSARHELARNYSKLAEAFEALEQRKEAIAQARQAQALLAELWAENPADEGVFHDYIFQHHLLSDLFRKAGENVEAMTHTRASLALMEPHLQQASATETPEMLYNDHQRFALMLRELGQLDRALLHYEQALELARKAVAETPNLFNANYVQSDIHRGMAITLTRQKNYRGALEQYQRGHEIMAALSERDPANIRLLHRLSQSLGNLADAFLLTGDRINAEQHLRQAITLEEELMKKVPARAPINLADRLKALADLLREKGDYQAAINHYERALQRMEPMVAQHPKDTLARRRLGTYFAYLGTCRLKLNETKAAQESLHQMLQVREELRAADMESPTFQSDLAYGYCLMGELSAQLATTTTVDRLAHWREARAWYQRGLELFLNLRQRGLLQGSPAAKPEETMREIARCDAAIAQLASH